jgi:hypothetical protein
LLDIVEVFTADDGKVRAIASTILSIYYDWKSMGRPAGLLEPLPPAVEYEPGPAFFLLTSFQSLETLKSSRRVNLNFYCVYLLSFSEIIH